MPRRKKKIKAAKSAMRPASAQRAVNWSAMRRSGIVTLWLLIIGGVIGGWMFGLPRVEAHLAEVNSADELEVRFTNAPSWMASEVLRQLEMTARLQLQGNPLAGDDLANARESLLFTGWFTDVKQVRRVSAALIEIEAAFCEQYALVRDSQGDHLVDRDGRLLPFTQPAGTSSGARLIIGARFDRPIRPGQIWEGADVNVALKLWRMIDAQAWQAQVAAVDISEYLSRETVRLITDRGSVIRWGRPPGEEHGKEVPAAQKLMYLDVHFKNHHHIDRGYNEVDVYLDRVVGR